MVNVKTAADADTQHQVLTNALAAMILLSAMNSVSASSSLKLVVIDGLLFLVVTIVCVTETLDKGVHITHCKRLHIIELLRRWA